MPLSHPSHRRQILIRLAFVSAVLAASLGALALGAEGIQYFRTGQSWILRPTGQTGHTIYDPLLGWTSVPSSDWPNLYGPGIGASYNARGFLATEEYADARPEGRVRILFLGDSFTEGLGVPMSDSYPAQLEQMEPRIQAVNLAKSSYGIDQAILRYERDARPMDADFVVLAAINHDLVRSRSDRFLGFWPKPRFEALPDGTLRLEGVPPPNFSEPPQSLWQVVQRSALFLIPRRFLHELTYRTEDSALADALFNRLRALASERSHRLALVYLPTVEELEEAQPLPLAGIMERYSLEHELPFVNLMPIFNAMSPEEQEASFVGVGNNHYNRRGHGVVAEALLREIGPALTDGP